MTTPVSDKDKKKILKARIAVNKKTNHVLHLILTLCTGGTWALVWVMVAMFNYIDRHEAMETLIDLDDI